MKTLITILAAITLLTSCASQKKYNTTACHFEGSYSVRK